MQDGNQNEPGWVFKPGDEVGPGVQAPPEQPQPEAAPAPLSTDPIPEQVPSPDMPHIEWTASEYIAHHKSAGWFGLLGLATVGIAVAVYLVTGGDIIATAVIGVLGLSLGIFAARQPKVLTYAVDNTGVHVGEKMYPYGSFKSFSVVHDQGIGYISLAPLRRFMPPLSIHYDPNDEEHIAQTLAEYLPYDDHKPDISDVISRKIRF